MRASSLAAALLALLLPQRGAAEDRKPAPEPVPTGPVVVLDRITAVVGEDIVLESEIDRMAGVGYLPPRAGESEGAYRDRVLDARINELLQERELRVTGASEPDPADVKKRMEGIEAAAAASRLGSFDAVLQAARTTREEVAQWVRRGVLLEAFVRERILPTVRIAQEELASYYDGTFRSEAATQGLTQLPPLSEVEDVLRALVRERKLDEAIAAWTRELRSRTTILIYRRGPLDVAAR